jgi:hypothetical protein
MEENKNVPSVVATTTTPAKKRVVKNSNVGNLYTSYEVKSKGYKETFSNIEDANAQYDILKKRAVKNKESVDIKILANRQDDEKQHIVRNMKIDSSFFED